MRHQWPFHCQARLGRHGSVHRERVQPWIRSLPKTRAINCFMTLFPKLSFCRHAKTTRGELLKFFGMPILITRCELMERVTLWSVHSKCKCIPSCDFSGRTGMPRDRFNAVMSHLVWSVQPETRPEGMTSKACCWPLVEDFVRNFTTTGSASFCRHGLCVWTNPWCVGVPTSSSEAPLAWKVHATISSVEVHVR